MPKLAKRAILCITIILCVMIVLSCIGYIIFDSYNRSRMMLLDKLFISQKSYMESKGSFASIDQLVSAGYITSDEIESAGNVIFCQPENVPTGIQWWATAGPWHPLQGNCYYINDRGEKFYHLMPFHFQINKQTGTIPVHVSAKW